MISIKKLIEEVNTLTLEELIEKYRKNSCTLYKDSERLEIIELQKFGTDKFSLEYFYNYTENQVDKNRYEEVKQLWKEVVFKVENGKNKIVYIELTNGHSLWEGRKFPLELPTESEQLENAINKIEELKNL